MEAIPTIVCDTLYAMGLHDQVSLTNAVFTVHFYPNTTNRILNQWTTKNGGEYAVLP